MADEPSNTPGSFTTPAAAKNDGAARELDALRDENGKLRDDLLRARADFVNYQGRASKELAEAQATALRQFVLDLLPTLDALGIAADDSHGGVVCRDMLRQLLEARGLEWIEARVGQKADPNVHNIIAVAGPEYIGIEGRIVSIVHAGYRWNGKVLRPSGVIVAGRGQGAVPISEDD